MQRNEILETIHNRRSLRAFADKPVSEASRRELLQATLRAPTAGNMMLYSIIDVRSKESKERLAVTCDNQPWIASAPMVLVFCADYQRWMDYFREQGAPEAAEAAGEKPREPGLGDLMLASSDAIIAAQTAVIAAESLGLASCYVGDILENYEEHQKLFALPPLAMPVAMLCIGYPKEREATKPETPRLAVETIVHTDRYNRLSRKALEEAFEPIRHRYFAEGRFYPGAANMGQHFYLKKFTAEFSREMDRSVRQTVQRWELAPGEGDKR